MRCSYDTGTSVALKIIPNNFNNFAVVPLTDKIKASAMKSTSNSQL